MSICAWFAGVAPERLATHRSTSRYLVLALGLLLLLVTGPMAGLAMGSYAYASLPSSLGLVPHSMIAIGIGAIWMTVVWTIDRALIISSDAVDSGRRLLLAAGVTLRLGLAGILASIFSDQWVGFLYRDILTTTAQHIALNLRERDAEQLAQEHGVPAAHKEVTGLEATVGELAEQEKTLPIWIIDQLNAAGHCERQAQQLALQLRRWPTLERQQALAQKNAICRKLRAVAIHNRDDYLQQIQARINKNDALLSTARDRVTTLEAAVAADRRKLDPATEGGYLSVSAREIAFKQLEMDHPEIRLTALRWWLVLLIIELLPIILKLTSNNHPAAAEAQAELAEDATHHRIRVRRLHALEAGSSRALGDIAVQEALDTVTAEYTIVITHLTNFGHFATRVVQEYQRQRDLGRAYPDLAVRLDAAFAEALASALGSAPTQRQFSVAAE